MSVLRSGRATDRTADRNQRHPPALDGIDRLSIDARNAQSGVHRRGLALHAGTRDVAGIIGLPIPQDFAEDVRPARFRAIPGLDDEHGRTFAQDHGLGIVTAPQQRAMATESGTERGEPPPARRCVVGKRSLEYEIDKGAGHLAVFAQHGGAVAL